MERGRHGERALHRALDLAEAGHAAPEDPPFVGLVEAVRVLRVPGVDGVGRARTPEELRVLLAHPLPDRAADAFALRLVRHPELVEVGNAVLEREDGGRPVRLGKVDAVRILLEEVAVIERATEALLEEILQTRRVDEPPVLVPRDLLATADERALAAMREELLREVLGRRDGHRGRRRQLLEERVDLDELSPGFRADRGVGQELLEVLGEVDGGPDDACVVGEATELVEVNDLVRLQRERDGASDGVGVDDQDLALRRLSQGCHDGQNAGLRGLRDGLLAHGDDLADEPEIVRLDLLHLEHARRERTHARTERLEGLDEAQVRLVEDATRHLQRGRRHLAEAADHRRVDAGAGERTVELHVAAVNDDGHEPHALQERQRGRERVEVVLDDRAARLHDRELRRVHTRVVAEVLLDLLAAADVGQETSNDVLRAVQAHFTGPLWRWWGARSSALGAPSGRGGGSRPRRRRERQAS